MLPQSDGGVVDSRLRVYGVQGLRVVDSSIFPIIPDAHTQVSWSVIMDQNSSRVGYSRLLC